MFDSSVTLNTNWINVLLAIPMTAVMGLYVAAIYRKVMSGFAYSTSILQTLIFLGMVVSLVMIVISNEVARAFTLVGALAVIRFRTPIKDPRDAAFIFMALAGGMGAGVGLYVETALGIGLIGLCILGLHWSRFGLQTRGETLVKFSVPLNGKEPHAYSQEVFADFLDQQRLINARSLPDGSRLELTYLVEPKRNTDMGHFSRTLSAVPQIERTSIIVARDEEMS